MPEEENIAAERAELRRLIVEGLAALALAISPVILLYFLAQVGYPLFRLGLLGSDVFIIYSFLAIIIGIGAIPVLVSIIRTLRKHIGRGSTLTYTTAEKLKLMVPWWLIMGGIVLSGISALLTFTEAFALAAGVTLLDELLSVAGLLGGIVALSIGFYLNRRNASAFTNDQALK